MWSDITSWISDKIAGMKVLAADFNLILSYIKKVYDNTVYLKTLVAAISNTTLYTSASYAMTDIDGCRNIFVYADTADVIITLPKKSLNRNRPARIVYVKGGTYKVIVNPHADDVNTLSGDGMASMWLAKVGNYVEFIESEDTGFWEVVNERIAAQLVLDTFAGYGSTDNKIQRFTNKTLGIGNMFSENHTSGYDGNAKGLEIIAQRSGWYYFSNTRAVNSASNGGFTLNSAALTSDIYTLAPNFLACNLNQGGANTYDVSVAKYIESGDVVRFHTDGVSSSSYSNKNIAIVEYLGQ